MLALKFIKFSFTNKNLRSLVLNSWNLFMRSSKQNFFRSASIIFIQIGYFKKNIWFFCRTFYRNPWRERCVHPSAFSAELDLCSSCPWASSSYILDPRWTSKFIVSVKGQLFQNEFMRSSYLQKIPTKIYKDFFPSTIQTRIVCSTFFVIFCELRQFFWLLLILACLIGQISL